MNYSLGLKSEEFATLLDHAQGNSAVDCANDDISPVLGNTCLAVDILHDDLWNIVSLDQECVLGSQDDRHDKFRWCEVACLSL